MEKDKNFVSQAKRFCRMINAFILICLFSVIFCSCEDNHNLQKKYHDYVSCLTKYREKNLIDENKYQRFKTSPMDLENESTADWDSIKSQIQKNFAVQDSLENVLTELQQLAASKPKGHFKIKRIWQNSDTQPWTYWSYMHIYLRNTGGSSGILTRFGRIGQRNGDLSLQIDGKAQGAGENRLDYINVVLADNSFYQFSIKNNPEWLLVQEGDLVERNEKNELVPLFKK